MAPPQSPLYSTLNMVAKVRSFYHSFDPNLWILAIGSFFSSLGFASSIPFLSIYLHGDLDLTPTQVGLFFAVMAVIRSVFQAVGGELSDRIGRKWPLIHSQTIRAVTFVFLGLAVGYAWGFWWIGILFALNSIFGSMFQASANALISDLLPPERRLDGYAVARSANNLGWALGPAIGGLLARESYASLFYLSAVLLFLSSLIFRFRLKFPAFAPNSEKFQVKDLLAVKDDKWLAWHAGLALALFLVVGQLIAPFSLYSVEMVGISEATLGKLFMLNGFMVVALQLPITRWFANWRFTTQLWVGSLLYFVGYTLIGSWATVAGFAVAMVIVTLGEMLVSPPNLTLTSRLAPPGRTGRYMGVCGFVETGGWSMAPLYGGVLLDKLGNEPALAWLTISSLALIPAIGYAVLGKFLPKEFNRRET